MSPWARSLLLSPLMTRAHVSHVLLPSPCAKGVHPGLSDCGRGSASRSRMEQYTLSKGAFACSGFWPRPFFSRQCTCAALPEPIAQQVRPPENWRFAFKCTFCTLSYLHRLHNA